MKRITKRLLSMLIVVAMALSMLPMISFAAGTMTTVYCQAPDSWTSCKIHWWGSADTPDTSWPGVDMDIDPDGIWFIEVPSDAAGLVINDGSGSQTQDLLVPTDENNMFVVAGRYWTTYGWVEPEIAYYVVGYFNDWNPCDPEHQMSLQEDGTYAATLTLPAGEHELKITTGTWYNCWPVDHNCTFSTTADGNVTVSFDGSTITVTGDYVEEEVPAELWTVYFQPTPAWDECYVYWWGSTLDNPVWPGYPMTLNEEGVWEGYAPFDCLGLIFNDYYGTQTNDMTPPDYNGYLYRYDPNNRYVVGTFNNWSQTDPNYLMTLLGDGSYTLTFPVTAGEHWLKITDGTWDNCWGNPDGSDFTFSTSADGDVTVSFDGTNITVTGEYLEEVDLAELWTVYFQAPVAWEECCVYWWGSVTNNVAWPGNPMTMNEEGLWEGVVPADCEGVVFTNNESSQTPDLVPPAYPGYLYSVDLGALYISGSFNDWAENDPAYQMVPLEDGNYELFFSVPAGNHLFKIISSACLSEMFTTDFTTYQEGWVWISYNPYESSLGLNAEFSGPTAEDIRSINLVGDKGLTGTDWDWEANEMTQNGSQYSITFTNVPSGDYAYYFAANGSWELTWGANEVEPGVNCDASRTDINYLTVPYNNATVTICFDITNMDPITGEGAQCMVTMEAIEPDLDPEAAYYVAGTMNGWVPNDSEYIMDHNEDGTVSLTFTVSAGAHQLKVTNGTWDQCWGNSDGSNFIFNTATDGEVTVTFDGYFLSVTGDCLTEAEYWTVYYEVPEDWIESYVYVYWWGSNIYNPEWPGVPMTWLMDNIWQGEVPSDCLGVVFSNEAGYQSEDLPAPSYDEYFYGTLLSEPLTDPLKIVDAAYALDDGETLPYSYTLTGEIITVDTPYNETYDNITVTMIVPGREGYPIKCYRLAGEEVADLTIGDIITVEGYLTNYYGTIEFAQGCILLDVIKGEGQPVPIDPLEIVDAAYALAVGETLPYGATLTGVITGVNNPYSDMYHNITVTIAVEGREHKPIVCFRMKGDEAEYIKVGDIITVTGTLKNYNGTIEFDSGCRLVNVIYAPADPEPPTDPMDIVDAAYRLAAGETLPYEAALTGVITEVNTPYDDYFCNVTFTLTVPGFEDKPFLCYRVQGERADILAVGDTVRVTGYIQNYNGTIEFMQGSAVTVDGSNISGSFRCFTENESSATVNLYRKDVDTAHYLYFFETTNGDYVFESFPAGEYLIVVSKDNHVTRTYEVTLGEEDITLDVQINLIGDVTGDGRVNVGDVSRIYAHAKKVNSLDDYEFLCADVTGDGRVNVGDASRVYGHSKKINPLW